MGMKIDFNQVGLQGSRQAAKANSLLSRSLERLASASRINRAADDASGLQIAERFNSQVRQGQVEIGNLQSGISAAQTADSGLALQQDATQRLRELALQASNGTLNSDQRAALNQEAQQLVQQIGGIAEGTEFNGQNLLNQNTSIDPGAAGSATLEISGSNANVLGLDTLDLSTPEGAAQSLQSIDSALNQIGENRSGLGAQANRFASAIEQRESETANAQAAESLIRDADVAHELIRKTQAEVLTRASLSGILQANLNASSVSKLLQ